MLSTTISELPVVCPRPIPNQALASGAWDKTVRLWRPSDGTLVRTLNHSDNVTSVAFSSDGTTLAAGAWDGTVRLWRVGDGAVLRTMGRHKGQVIDVAFSPDGAILASAGAEDATVRLWRVSDGRFLRPLAHPSNVYAVAFSPDGTFLASGAWDGLIRLWGVP